MNWIISKKLEYTEVHTPKFPFTNIPNPLGTAIFTYENGMKKFIPFYYVQKIILIFKKKINYILKIKIKKQNIYKQ